MSTDNCRHCREVESCCPELMATSRQHRASPTLSTGSQITPKSDSIPPTPTSTPTPTPTPYIPQAQTDSLPNGMAIPCKSSDMWSLPAEVLRMVFVTLQKDESHNPADILLDMLSASLVSRWWYDVTTMDGYIIKRMRRLSLRKFNYVQIQKLASLLRLSKITCGVNYGNEIGTLCADLRILLGKTADGTRCYNKVIGRSLVEIYQMAESVSLVHLTGSWNNEEQNERFVEFFQSINLPQHNVVALRLDHLSSPSDILEPSLATLITNMPCLRLVRIGCTRIEQNVINALGNSSHLEYLHLGRLSTAPSGRRALLDAINKLKALRRLELDDIQTEDFVNELVFYCRNLHVLKLGTPRFVPSATLAAAVSSVWVRTEWGYAHLLENLTHFNASTVAMLNDQFLKTLLEHATGLVELGLWNCGDLTGMPIVREVSTVRSTQLMKVILRKCRGLTPRFVIVLLEVCARLKELEIGRTFGVKEPHNLVLMKAELKRVGFKMTEGTHTMRFKKA
ncbi:hypothetical protein BC936DRAFT_141094 [Jimgerdemannia flammicorona]|uniref:F-box domain-containing protein n=1 Tax=Jimgerdemannia flammicorona TaxID=994334 RepID=A0A433A2X0_9FUNG|nr:hypothetical protein BC936DRAFT_141094 [Jimgerdemannia flammicorona]